MLSGCCLRWSECWRSIQHLSICGDPSGFVACLSLNFSFFAMETKWNWTIFCGLSSLSCMDSNLFRRFNWGVTIEGKDLPLPGLLFLTMKIFIKQGMKENTDLFLCFMGKFSSHDTDGIDSHIQTLQRQALHTERESLFQTDTYMLSTGHLRVVAPEDYTILFFFMFCTSFLNTRIQSWITNCCLLSPEGLPDPLTWYSRQEKEPLAWRGVRWG